VHQWKARVKAASRRVRTRLDRAASPKPRENEQKRFFGRCLDHLGEFAWYVPNSQQRTWPVGSLKPNDLGVFDIHGNLHEWCLNRQGTRFPTNADGIAFDVEEANRRIEPLHFMLTRGGSYNDHAPVHSRRCP
jgi:formylglycine-generating enzyme required for sulfatase activity